MTTLDFELEIGPSAAGSYQVLARGPSGEAATTLSWSLTPAELDHQLAVIKKQVPQSSTVVRRAPTEDEQPVRQLGQQLFQTLITDDVRSLYVASSQYARGNNSTLRLVLRVRPPELARLPWEFLFDPGENKYLSLQMPVVRYLPMLGHCGSRRRCGSWAWSPARVTSTRWIRGRSSSGCRRRWRICKTRGRWSWSG